MCAIVNAKERSGTVIYSTRFIQSKFFLIDLLFRPSLLAVLNGTGVSLFSFPRRSPHPNTLTLFVLQRAYANCMKGFFPFMVGKEVTVIEFLSAL